MVMSLASWRVMVGSERRDRAECRDRQTLSSCSSDTIGLLLSLSSYQTIFDASFRVPSGCRAH